MQSFIVVALLAATVRASGMHAHRHQDRHVKRQETASAYVPSAASDTACGCTTYTTTWYGEAFMAQDQPTAYASNTSAFEVTTSTTVYSTKYLTETITLEPTGVANASTAAQPTAYSSNSTTTAASPTTSSDTTTTVRSTVYLTSTQTVSPVGYTESSDSVSASPTPAGTWSSSSAPVQSSTYVAPASYSAPSSAMSSASSSVTSTSSSSAAVASAYSAPSVPITWTSSSSVVVSSSPSSTTTSSTSISVAASSYTAPSSSWVASSSSQASTSTSTSSTSTSTSASATASSIAVNGTQWAMTYTPYANDGSCKTADDVTSDITAIKAKGFTTVRLYATDCSGVQNIGTAAAAVGLKVVLGVYIDDSGIGSNTDEQVSTITSWGQAGNWGMVDMVVFGNEAIFNGYTSASALAGAITSVKGTLQAAGYSGPVTTTEPMNIMQDNADTICPVVDVIAANIQAFFNDDISASQAGTFVASQLTDLAGLCNNEKDAYNLESGWPWNGDTNGAAVPGVDEQKIAIAAIVAEAGSKSAIFSFENDVWKSPGDLDVEQYWGCAGLFSG